MEGSKRSAALLHVGALREQLETLAAADGMRWQDLARIVLKNYIHGKQLEAAAQAVTLEKR